MFHQTVSQIAHTIVRHNTKKCYFSSKNVQRKIVSDLNRVKLLGTLNNDIVSFGSGVNSFTVKTLNSPDGDTYQLHKVQTLGFGDLKAGQRVQVVGTLKTDQFKLDDGKIREKFIVLANQIILLQSKEDAPAIDFNHIDIVGHVAAKVHDTQNYTMFKMATHLNIEKSEETRVYTDYLSFIVYDNELREQTKRLDVSDRLLIGGTLRNQTNLFTNGKRISSGFITPTNIEKLLHSSNYQQKRDTKRYASEFE